MIPEEMDESQMNEDWRIALIQETKDLIDEQSASLLTLVVPFEHKNE